VNWIVLAQTTTSEDDAFGGVKDFFDSEIWFLIRNVAIFFVVLFWLASAFWVYKDARRRIEDNVLLSTAVALGIVLPFLGALLYMLFRPPEYIEDVRERELEIKAMEESLDGSERCPVCRAEVPGLPRLHDEAEAGLPPLQGAARAALADLPLLRDAGRDSENRRESLAFAAGWRSAPSFS